MAAPFVLTSQNRRERPDVLMIAVDDLNDWVSCLGGHPNGRTPNLDRLASRGVLFTNAHCAAPLCNPSRAALMTGIRPSTSGIYTNSQPMRKSPALKNAVSLTQHFMASGYRAVGGGKIYHGGYPDAASWNEYFPSQTKNKPDDPLPKRPANGIAGTGHFDWGPVNVPGERMGDHQVVDWAIGEMNRPRTQPLFLGAGLFRPHLPWYVPPKYFDMFPLGKIELPRVKDDDLDDVPAQGRKFAKAGGDHKSVIDNKQWKQAVQGYLASIAFMDAQLGRLMEGFEKSPMSKRNPVVLLWSDHGWHLGEKLHWRKFSLWEESTRNVFTMTAPGVTKPGQRCGRTVSTMDIYPTLVDLCGLPKRPELEGASLRPLLANPGAAWDRPAVCTYFRNNHSVRSERWRYTRYQDGGEELYDHHADPMEWENLAKRPEYHTIRQELARFLPTVNAPDSVQERGSGEE